MIVTASKISSVFSSGGIAGAIVSVMAGVCSSGADLASVLSLVGAGRIGPGPSARALPTASIGV